MKTNTEPADPKVHLTLTIPQARAMVAALDIFMRLGLGQVSMVAEMVADGSISIKVGSLEIPESDVIHNVAVLCNGIRRELGFQPGESYGVGNRAVSDKAHRAYEIEKVIKKALAMHDNPNPTFRGVDYDGLSIRYTDDPAPECVIAEGAKP
ncbi:hypothetical protein HAQ01_04690 [Acidithiobacillus thiooxidans]|uniref:hypothetical protein n=1 Tax=Acidithiobacillus thiooxidans TaxID=930 RepID=UPI001C065EB7|nr:hypothetical protein [Acidithiobacillus thiooxidans]MBU2792719.1 hypothetical protein [Acidithiobacillus thiooxidans]